MNQNRESVDNEQHEKRFVQCLYLFSSLIIIFAKIINILIHFCNIRQNMGTGKINRLKIVLVEQGKTVKWLSGQLEKMKLPFHVGVQI